MEVIPEYGTDALRLALIQGMSEGNDQRLGRSKIVTNRNFCNKIWNVARYVEDVIGEEKPAGDVKPVTAADHWILNKLQRFQDELGVDVEAYRFSEAYAKLYHFVWDDLADWYIEASKAEPNKPLLAYLLEAVVTLAHPFAPFVTETVWQTLAWETDSVLATRSLQKVPGSDRQQAANFDEIQAIVREVRLILNALKASGITLYYTDVPFLRDNAVIIKRLSRLTAVTEVKDGTGLFLTGTRHRCWLDVDTAMAREYLKGLAGKREEQETSIKRLRDRLANKEYVKHAPGEVVKQTKDQLAEAEELLKTIEAERRRFGAA